MRRPGLFLDRDGTLIHPRHYPTRPEELVLYDGLGPELRTLREQGFRLVIITNQSGLARGLFTQANLDSMHSYLSEEMSRLGAPLDGVYHCPHHPEGSVPALAVECDCRKPMPGMLLQAADELDLDLSASWFVGDILDDIEAGNRAGCRTVLVDIGTESTPTSRIRTPDYVARSTRHALKLIQAVEGIGQAEDLEYTPPSWRGQPVSGGRA